MSEQVKLACSRCGLEVTKPYQVGRCYDEQSKPDEMDEHDEAESWEFVHGKGERPQRGRTCGI